MILTKADFMKVIKERVGDDTSDESLKFIEDMNDTYNDLEKKLNPNKKTDEQWEEELKKKDEEWREKYKARFFEGVEETGNNITDDKLLMPEDNKPTKEETITVDDLFKESEVK